MFAIIRVRWRKAVFFILCIAVATLLVFCFTDKLFKDLNADTFEKRKQLAKLYGFDISNCEENSQTVLVPDSYNEAFNKYSKTLSDSGFDICRFSGLAVTRYSYNLTEEAVTLNLLVYKGNLIGADVFDLNQFEYLSIGDKNGNN